MQTRSAWCRTTFCKHGVFASIGGIDYAAGKSNLRLEAQLAAARLQVEASKSQIEVMQRNVEASGNVVAAYQTQLQAYEQVSGKIVLSSDAGVASAKHRLESQQRGLIAHEALLAPETGAFNLVKANHASGNASRERLIEAERQLIEAQVKLSEAEAVIQSAENDVNDVIEKQNEGDAKRLQAQTDVEHYKGMLAKAVGETKMANGELERAQSDLAKSQQELTDLENKLANRQEQQRITAPFNGRVIQITGLRHGQLIQKG